MTNDRATAYEALEKCFGIHEDSTEHEQAWGLKASDDDAVLAVLVALYPDDWPANDGEGIRCLRAIGPDLVNTYGSLSSWGLDLTQLVDEFLPSVYRFHHGTTDREENQT